MIYCKGNHDTEKYGSGGRAETECNKYPERECGKARPVLGPDAGEDPPMVQPVQIQQVGQQHPYQDQRGSQEQMNKDLQYIIDPGDRK